MTSASKKKPIIWIVSIVIIAAICAQAFISYFGNQAADKDDSLAGDPGGFANTPDPTEAERTSPDDPEMIQAPGLGKSQFITPLADAYQRIDPSRDGWTTEAIHDAVNKRLKDLADLMKATPTDEKIRELVSEDYVGQSFRPASVNVVFQDDRFKIQRAGANGIRDIQNSFGINGFKTAIEELREAFRGGRVDRVKLKQFKIAPNQNDHVETKSFFQAFGTTKDGSLQMNAIWATRWELNSGNKPKLTSIRVEKYEIVSHQAEDHLLFSDCTESVLGETQGYREQFLYSTDHWRSRLPRDMGLDVVANHGLAVGDVNGDNLDDLYICQQGGLPNRLLLQNSDGTLRDFTADCGADWLDYCASALFVDFDNDGDRDLAVAQEWRVLLMSNDGRGRFQIEFGIGSRAQSFSLAAADYDLDGDLDLFVCGYNPSASTLRRGAMGEPMPYHDANNGGPNMLLRNLGNWLFEDVTKNVGLEQNNTRYSFAASWEDFDNDGDPDLYVANDYGRNNLYRNDRGKFVDVAAHLGVEDMSAGMSVSWADFNRDGWMDLYVSNMFSAAGNRITYQRQFKSGTSDDVRRQFQRHARGNSLFSGVAGSGFRDVSEQAAVTMGRWAWGSRFVDLNSDGWEDLVVANGFITAPDTGDL